MATSIRGTLFLLLGSAVLQDGWIKRITGRGSTGVGHLGPMPYQSAVPSALWLSRGPDGYYTQDSAPGSPKSTSANPEVSPSHTSVVSDGFPAGPEPPTLTTQMWSLAPSDWAQVESWLSSVKSSVNPAGSISDLLVSTGWTLTTGSQPSTTEGAWNPTCPRADQPTEFIGATNPPYTANDGIWTADNMDAYPPLHSNYPDASPIGSVFEYLRRWLPVLAYLYVVFMIVRIFSFVSDTYHYQRQLLEHARNSPGINSTTFEAAVQERLTEMRDIEEALLSENQQLRDQVDALNKEGNDQGDFHQKLSKADQEIANLLLQLGAEKTAKEELEERVKQLEEDVETLGRFAEGEEELNALESEIGVATAEIVEENKELRADNDHWKKLVSELTVELNKKTKEVEKTHDHIEELHKRMLLHRDVEQHLATSPPTQHKDLEHSQQTPSTSKSHQKLPASNTPPMLPASKTQKKVDAAKTSTSAPSGAQSSKFTLPSTSKPAIPLAASKESKELKPFVAAPSQSQKPPVSPVEKVTQKEGVLDESEDFEPSSETTTDAETVIEGVEGTKKKKTRRGKRGARKSKGQKNADDA